MANGLDPEKGRLLVPFDLKEDVIRPLEKLEDNMAGLSSRFDAHLDYVDKAVKGRMEPIALYVEGQKKRDELFEIRRTKTKRGLIWAASIGGPILMALIAKVLGAPV